MIEKIALTGLQAADPYEKTRQALGSRPKGRVVVVAAGKAAGRMALAAEAAWGKLEGICVVPEGYETDLKHLKTLIAAHPVPKATSQEAARTALDMARSLKPEDTLLCLISGGGSALLSLPAAGLAFEEKAGLVKELLDKGARIQDLNRVRKSLSAIKGGRLAAATEATVRTVLVSDVVGDDPSFIASGPTIPATQSAEEVFDIFEKYTVSLSENQKKIIQENALPQFQQGQVEVILTPQKVLNATADTARKAGYTPLILGDALEGNAFSLGLTLAGMARSSLAHHAPGKPPLAIISGGETTAPVLQTGGRGGRNTECALGFLYGAGGLDVTAAFLDTDGIDGASGGAGALLQEEVIKHAKHDGPAIMRAHLQSDSASYLKAHNSLYMTGPTGTNTNDLRIILVGKPEAK